MNKKLKLTMAAISIVYLSGCSFTASNYGASFENVETIKKLGSVEVSVSDFTASKSTSGIACRGAGSVVTPNKETFEDYIHKAFVSELKLAGVYSDSAPIELKGHFTKIDFSSNIGNGNWSFELTASSSKDESIQIVSKHEFSTNWVADKACQQVAQELSPAVQVLIKDIVSNPEFKKLISSTEDNLAQKI
ncbi:hypothetical protein [Neptunomonas japonica]|uniref:hypothetical protein n=1 Tax=Neptunomonas japonica TaxID=417574 RepID=UPI000422F862|nr:hypothetical protein [Neptunomonas japonica]